ncbi:unnamed protein product [Cyprideis torosa]|uniref:Uncharacterized protein n=1 Tax=Cyprideis torosa TaxID=163714 RepID=A0A7R8W4W6_9CRUS|nr:unnamed protein product [Cyprideis torosa]CAG0883579.1 unnamed protein product [Cyprideis torosa]
MTRHIDNSRLAQLQPSGICCHGLLQKNAWTFQKMVSEISYSTLAQNASVLMEVSRLSGVELLETLDVCQTPEELQSFTDAQRWKAIVNELPEEMLLDLREREQMIREVLLDFSPSRDLDDAFRRIATARSKKFQPDWIWDFMAGIAWRTQGHVKRSLHCLLQAASKCPEFFRRIPLASIGNTAYVGGYLRAASEAYLLTLVGSASARNDEYYLFNTGSILASLGNVTGAIHYYQESLARKKDFEAAQKSLTEVACLIRQRSVFSKTASKGMSVEVFEEGEDPTCHLMIHPEAPDTVVVCSLVDCQTEGPCGTAEYVVCISVHRNRTGGWAVTSKDVERAAELNLTHCSFEPHQSDDSIRSLQQVLASQDFLKSVSLVEDVPVENVLEETSSSSEASVAPQRIQVKLVLQEPSTKETQSVEKSNKNLISGKVRITSTPSSGPLDRRPACRDDDVLPEALFSLPADLRRNEMVLTPDLTILAECSALVESTKGEPVVRFPPTWLSFSSKGIDITSIIPGYPKGPAPVLNVECPSQPPSMRTWDHLSGVARREELLSRNSPETALLDSLLSFMPEYALDARDAVDCLRHALHRAPRHAMDVPLVSLANVMGRAGLLNDALILAHAALEISPRYISVHLTIANFYALKRDLENAALFYRSALQLQSQFQPAKERLFKVECLMLHDQGLL